MFKWRRQQLLAEQPQAGEGGLSHQAVTLMPVTVLGDEEPVPAEPGVRARVEGLIEITLGGAGAHPGRGRRHDVGSGPVEFTSVIGLPSGTRVWLAAGSTDLRRGFDGLAALVQTQLACDPFSGHLFVFRGRRGDLLKVLWWDGQGMCLFSKRLERGRFVWPAAPSGSVALTPAQLSMLIEGIDWRIPRRTFQPHAAA